MDKKLSYWFELNMHMVDIRFPNTGARIDLPACNLYRKESVDIPHLQIGMIIVFDLFINLTVKKIEYDLVRNRVTVYFNPLTTENFSSSDGLYKNGFEKFFDSYYSLILDGWKPGGCNNSFWSDEFKKLKKNCRQNVRRRRKRSQEMTAKYDK